MSMGSIRLLNSSHSFAQVHNLHLTWSRHRSPETSSLHPVPFLPRSYWKQLPGWSWKLDIHLIKENEKISTWRSLTK